MKKVLVTGGAGFIGSNVVDLYIKEGFSVIVIDNLSTGKKENLNKKAKFYQIDLQEKERIKKIFEEEKPDFVNHHAAQSSVNLSMRNPVKDAKINILGSINLFKIAAKHKVKKIIYISSGGAMYGQTKSLPANEKTYPKPLSFYAISKFTAENYLRAMAEENRVPHITLRYSNIYGPRQDPLGEAGVVAIFIGLLLKGKQPTIFGNGKQTRDYCYVADVARANILATEKETRNKAINIGNGKPSSVLDIYKGLKKSLNSEVGAKFGPPRKGEVRDIYLDISLAKKELDWVPKVNLEEGLKKTVEWQKST
jgi:UDP-glucose 4-epimerase